jgi:hydroxyethylthiazole kinase-like sugar kinase family protein
MTGKSLAERISDLEGELATLDQEWQSVPDFIDARLRVSDARLARLATDVAALRRDVVAVAGKVDALADGVRALAGASVPPSP